MADLPRRQATACGPRRAARLPGSRLSGGRQAPPAPIVRLILEHEYEAVGALTAEAYASAYEIDPNGTYIADLRRVADRAAAHQVWVAEDPGTSELLGTVTTPMPGQRLNPFAGECDMDLRMLAVAPHARGRGVARAIMEHCKDLARSRGATRLVLHTADDMDLAIALYDRMGFERVPEIEADFPYPPEVWYPVRVYATKL